MSPTRMFLITLTTLLVHTAVSVAAREAELRDEPFELRCLAGDEEHGRLVLGCAREALERVTQALRLAPSSGPITIVLAASDGHFIGAVRTRTGSPPPRWALALAVPSARAIIIRAYAMQPGTSNSLTSTLRHELAHLLLHDAIPQGLPRWLDEGLAMWAGGQRLTYAEHVALAVDGRNRLLPRFAAIESELPRHDPAVRRSYLQSLAFIEWLEAKARPRGQGIVDLVAELKGGVPWDTALFRVVPIDEPELEFRYDLDASASSLALLATQLSLWQLIPLLVFVAFLRALNKARKIRRRMAAEDAAADLAGNEAANEYDTTEEPAESELEEPERPITF